MFVFSIGSLKEAREVEKRMAELTTEDEEHIIWASVGSKGKRKIKKRTFDDYELEQDDDGISIYVYLYYIYLPMWALTLHSSICSYSIPGNVCDELPSPPSGYKMAPHEAEDVAPRTKGKVTKLTSCRCKDNSGLYLGGDISYVMMTLIPKFYLSGTSFKSDAADLQSMSQPASTSTNHQGKVDLVTL